MRQSQYMSANDIKYLVLHCSASRCNEDYSVEQLRRDHKARGFYDIGYHFYIRKDGTMTQHRMLLEVGAHARPYNRCSIGICYEGGLDEQGKPCNTMTTEQETRLIDLFRNRKHPTPMTIQLHPQCLLGIQGILRNWTFLIFKQV